MTKLKSVNTILSTFRKTITKLSACEKDHEDHAVACSEEAEVLTRRSQYCTAEAKRAGVVMGKLKELIGE